jgi:hypothetical protein
MVALNAHLEVADFVNESQFETGESAYICVALHTALIKYAGAPGHGPTGTGEQVDQLADFWYGKEEGSFAASNTNGMSLDAEYMMLRGMGVRFYPLPITAQSTPTADIAAVEAWLALGFPVLICGAETGMFDMDMGDVVPYSWQPSGNHCIAACGVASDGNLLVRDAASIAPSGVRPGPRRYDIARMQLISGTALQVPWLTTIPTGFDPTKEDSVLPLDIRMPAVLVIFFELDATHWQSRATKCILQDGLLANYKANGQASLDYLGDVVQNEVYLGPGKVMQRHAKGVRLDDNNTYSSLPLYGNQGEHVPGEDPLVLMLETELTGERDANAKLQTQLAALQAVSAPVGQKDAFIQQIVNGAKALGFS